MRVVVYVPAGARSADRVREELLQTALREGFKREQIGFADTAKQVYNARAQYPDLVVYCRPRHRVNLVPHWVIAVGGAAVGWIYTGLRRRRRPRLAAAGAATVAGAAAVAAFVLADDPDPPRFGAVSPPPSVVVPTTGGPGPTSTAPSAPPAATAPQPSTMGSGGGLASGSVPTADGQRSPSAPPVTPPRSEPPVTTAPAEPSAGQPEDDCLLGIDVSLPPILDLDLCVGISRSGDSLEFNSPPSVRYKRG
jgi:hypothetical protein